MKIAILGAGFSGLAAAWYILQQQSLNPDVTVFDELPTGSSSSGIAGGLLHPYAGAHAKKSWAADEGMKAAMELISVSSKAQELEVARQEGLLRFATNESQMDVYRRAADLHSDVSWWDARQCEFYVHHIVHGVPGIFIRSAWSVHCSRYLHGLHAACDLEGAKFIREKIENLETFKDFDVIVVAAGYLCTRLPELKGLPFKVVKGQAIELEWKRDLFPPPFPLKSDAYLVMNPGGDSCTVGATYEHDFEDVDETTEEAADELVDKVEAFYPRIRDLKVVGRKSGARCTTPGHLPVLAPLDTKTWIFSGLGSKGLLYHGYMGKLLSEALIRESSECIPEEFSAALQ